MPHVPVPRSAQIRRAIESLDVLIRLDTRVQGRRAADVPAEELVGLLFGIVDLIAFGIDPVRQPREMAALVKGYAQAVAGHTEREMRDATYLAALGLKAGLASELLTAGAEAAYVGQSQVGKAGTTMAAARLAGLAQELVMAAVGAPGPTLVGTAGKLRKIADLLDNVAASEALVAGSMFTDGVAGGS